MVQNTTFAELNFVNSDGTSIGAVVIQLFDDPSLFGTAGATAAQQFITLATKYITSGGKAQNPTAADPAFYTNVLVHRVIPEFIIQSGDATNGDGTGTSPLPNVTDSYGATAGDNNLGIFGYEGVGVLGLAEQGDQSGNAVPNTGNDQFFITDAPFSASGDGTKTPAQMYPIFGQVISGWDVITDIINRQADSNNKPLDTPKLQSVTIVHNNEAGSLLITPDAGFSGSEQISVKLDDGHGGVTTQTFVIQSTEPDLPSISGISSIDLEQPGQQYTVTYNSPQGFNLNVTAFSNYHPADQMLVQNTNLGNGNWQVKLTPGALYDNSTFTVIIEADLTNFGNATPVVQNLSATSGPITQVADQVLLDGQTLNLPIEIQQYYNPTVTSILADDGSAVSGLTASFQTVNNNANTLVLTASSLQYRRHRACDGQRYACGRHVGFVHDLHGQSEAI